MAKRQKLWARTARINLLLKLGMVCKSCGAEDKLTFDCIYPTGDAHHRMDTSQRMSYYHRQEREGNLQVLCAGCNAVKRHYEMEQIEMPF